MSATIKTYGFSLTALANYMGAELIVHSGDGLPYVLHADHLASHAYDEEKERALCNQFMQDNACSGPYSYEDMWLACAKSRAKAAGCE